MVEGQQIIFEGEGVKVTVPTQAPPVAVLGQPPFELRRVVIILNVVEAGDPGKTVTQFNPPIELRVQYTQGDLDFAASKERDLALAFWDGGAWVRFTAQKHKFRLESDATLGDVGVVEISSWIDPPIGWGA